ncbi:MAG: DUF4276 family protein [Myxococcota bacterium]
MFEGKQDLEKQLTRRLRGYLVPKVRFVVLRDQDAGDCVVVKGRLRDRCVAAGRADAIVRIACREIESWYLADLAAVERGLGVVNLSRWQAKKAYQAPDAIHSPARELRRLAPSYQKIAGSRAIAPHLDIENRRSRSFANFISAVQRAAAELDEGAPAKSSVSGG